MGGRLVWWWSYSVPIIYFRSIPIIMVYPRLRNLVSDGLDVSHIKDTSRLLLCFSERKKQQTGITCTGLGHRAKKLLHAVLRGSWQSLLALSLEFSFHHSIF
ncbi:hypothetical protein BJX70DRAFT_77504 [Aspergillus crustosus]